MRRITHLVVHCTATDRLTAVESIQRYWREVMRWKSPGYHVIVKVDGTRVRLQGDDKPTNGVAGHNATSLHVSYIGGVVPGRVAGQQLPADTRTPQQKDAILAQLKEWRKLYPDAVICGHRDMPGANKACPSYDARAEYAGI